MSLPGPSPTERPAGGAGPDAAGRPEGTPPSRWSSFAAVLIGLAGAVAIWLVTPYNNYVLANANISDSYLPVIVLFLTLILVLAANPVLWRFAPRFALTRRQLATIIGIMLMACVIPGQGLMRNLPYMIANVPPAVSSNSHTAGSYERLGLPAWMFPDKLGFGEDVSASQAFRGQLDKDQPIPWSHWVRPLVFWGGFLLFAWLMMMGLGMVVMPQWRNNERLAFPLLSVQEALIERPAPGRLIAPLFTRRAFWVAGGAVFLLHLVNGASVYWPGSVPSIPVQWNLHSVFADPPWTYMPHYLYAAKVMFLFVGVSFFMPNRVSFSIWFFLVAYGLWRALSPMYGGQFIVEKTDDQRLGALIVLGLFILWVGRLHWARVLRCQFSRAATAADRRDRTAAWALTIGAVGLCVWLTALGVQFIWALMLVGFIFLVSLVVARFVAETGLPFFRIYDNPAALMSLAPVRFISPVSAYFCAVVNMLFAWGSRVNPTAVATQAMALGGEEAVRRPRGRGVLFLAVLIGGLFVAGAVHLNAGYRNDSTLNGEQAPFNSAGRGGLTPAIQAAEAVENGQENRSLYNRPAHIGLGGTLAGLLYAACLAMPRWPLHPIGFLMVDSYYGHEIWASVFFGWLAKTVLVGFGGAGLYRKARAFFLGLIVGEVVAAVFWALVPAIAAGAGHGYRVINVIPV